MKHSALLICIVLLAGFTNIAPGMAQRGPDQSSPATPAALNPPCQPGARGVTRPPDICAETILDNLTSQGIASISGLTFGPDGSLYFARPATSQIMRMQPDGNGFFRAPDVFADALPEPPNGLTYDSAESAWFVSMDTTILRLRMVNGSLERQTLVSGLPGGAGGWLGDIRVGPDRRLYVAKAASCDACIEADPRRGALLSFALDGSDRRVVARGLRDSYEFDWVGDMLYIVDDERVTMPAELDALTPQDIQSGTVDFGWPRCDSLGKPVAGIDGANAATCAKTRKPVWNFDPGSHPSGVVYYHSTAPYALDQGLYVALAGSWNAKSLFGYELWVISITGGKLTDIFRLMPTRYGQNASNAAITGTSFYPYHLTALAVSPEGWLYASVAEGRIYRIRKTR